MLIICAIYIDNFILHNYPDYRKFYEFNIFSKISNAFQTQKNYFFSLISNVEKDNIAIEIQPDEFLKVKKKKR